MQGTKALLTQPTVRQTVQIMRFVLATFAVLKMSTVKSATALGAATPLSKGPYLAMSTDLKVRP